MWNEWIEQKIDGLEGEKDLLLPYKELYLAPPFQPFLFFLSSEMPYPKVDSHQREFEEDLTLFIVKEQMPLSFVEALFFRRLILRHNFRLTFPSW
jgi:hypothetical protein